MKTNKGQQTKHTGQVNKSFKRGNDRKFFKKKFQKSKEPNSNKLHEQSENKGGGKQFKQHVGNQNHKNPGRPHNYNHNRKKFSSNKRNSEAQNQHNFKNLDSLFLSKPAKLDYCLAPERLEAQARAMKRFQQNEDVLQRQKTKERRHKMMTMKTKKGQPVMQGRMELLYEKVQKIVGQG